MGQPEVKAPNIDMTDNLKIVYGGAVFGSGEFTTVEKVEEVLKALEEVGVKEIDTAQIYPNSEELLGKAGAGARFTIDTKHGGGFVPGTSSREQLIERANDSFKKIDSSAPIGIFYLHAPDRSAPLEETLEAVNELHKEGKFKEFGLSNFQADEVEEVVRIAKEKGYVLPSVYQGNYNAISRLNETELLPVLRKHHIAFYAYSPIAGGFLTKTKEKLLAGGEGRWDANTRIGGFYNQLYTRPGLLEALDQWNRISEETGISKAELAYRWVAFSSALGPGDGLVVGSSSIRQLQGTVEFLKKGRLEEKIVKEIEEVWEKVKGSAFLDNFNRS